MKNLFNVQTKNNVKEAVKDSANIEYLATGKEKVVLVGRDLSSKVSLPRYSSLFFIFSLFEEDLEEPLNFDVNISVLALESLAKALIALKPDDGNKKTKSNKSPISKEDIKFGKSAEHDFSFRLFKNISAKNFFRLINDISVQSKYKSSDEIASKYLECDTSLTKLNNFYNRFDHIYDNCANSNYSMLYLFDDIESNLSPYQNVMVQIKGNNAIVSNNFAYIITSFENEVARNMYSESIKNDYYSMLEKIDKNIEKLKEKIQSENKIYSIEALYEEI